MLELLNKSGLELINGKLIDNLNFIINTKFIKKRSIFIPLRGKRDGHDFIIDGVKNGLCGFIVDYDHDDIIDDALKINRDLIILKCRSPFKSMVNLAYNIRDSLSIPVIGITGSYGKTTTKEMILSVLRQKYNVLYTKENQNNIIGMCLTLINYHNEDIVLLELGSNHHGEIKQLVDISKPNITVITHIGSSHIGYFRSKKGILREKCDINRYSKIFFKNMDDKFLRRVKVKGNAIPYSINDIEKLNIKNKISFLYDNVLFIINCDLYYLIMPSIISIKIGRLLDIDYKLIKNGIYNFKNVSGRMEKIKKGKYLIINDSYNASYENVISGIRYFDGLGLSNKLLILGDVLELGNKSKRIHKKIGKFLKKNNFDLDIYLVGSDVRYIYGYLKGYNVRLFNSVKDIKKEDLKSRNIYLKASNRINLSYLISL